MAGDADLIIRHARVLTMDEANPRAKAVAVKDGRIALLGDDASVMDRKGPGTRVIDAGGGTVLPGFIEAHMHLFTSAAELDHEHRKGRLKPGFMADLVVFGAKDLEGLDTVRPVATICGGKVTFEA